MREKTYYERRTEQRLCNAEDWTGKDTKLVSERDSALLQIQRAEWVWEKFWVRIGELEETQCCDEDFLYAGAFEV